MSTLKQLSFNSFSARIVSSRVHWRLTYYKMLSSVCCTPSCNRVHPNRRNSHNIYGVIVSGRVYSVTPIILHIALSLSICYCVRSSGGRRLHFLCYFTYLLSGSYCNYLLTFSSPLLLLPLSLLPILPLTTATLSSLIRFD